MQEYQPPTMQFTSFGPVANWTKVQIEAHQTVEGSRGPAVFEYIRFLAGKLNAICFDSFFLEQVATCKAPG